MFIVCDTHTHHSHIILYHSSQHIEIIDHTQVMQGMCITINMHTSTTHTQHSISHMQYV